MKSKNNFGDIYIKQNKIYDNILPCPNLFEMFLPLN